MRQDKDDDNIKSRNKLSLSHLSDGVPVSFAKNIHASDYTLMDNKDQVLSEDNIVGNEKTKDDNEKN